MSSSSASTPSSAYVRSNLVNFFIYNTEYGQKEGTEEEKIMFFIPKEENLGKKINAVGISQALIQFASTFRPKRVCECLVTQKTKQYFSNPEGSYWIVMTLSIPYLEKTVKDNKVVEYFTDDVQDNIIEALLQQSYDMFVLFNGLFSFINNKFGLPALKDRFEFFYTRYLQTLNFGQLDLLDVYQGVHYLPLDKIDFLKVQCFSNLVENTFPCVKHVCVLHQDQLLWSTLNKNNMRILYKYLTTSLFPASNECDGDGGGVPSPCPAATGQSQYNSSQFPNPGRFLTAPLEMVSPANTIPKRSPRVFLDVDNETCEMNLLVYKTFNLVVCLMVDLHALNSDLCAKIHSFVGPQLGSLANMISEQITKRASSSTDQQYRFIYFNSMNLAIKSSIHSKKTSSLVSVAPEIMRLLVDMHADLGKASGGSEIIVKTLADCWIVGKQSGSREFFVILNQKNASIVEIDEELKRLIATCFNNILFLD